MFIEGIGIANYRSFGNDLQRIGPFKKLNLFIGQNNSGKSNILRFLTFHYKESITAPVDRRGVALHNIDRHKGKNPGEYRIAFGVAINGQRYNELMARIPPTVHDQVKKILEAEAFTKHTNLVWFDFDLSSSSSLTVTQEFVQQIKAEGIMSHQHWSRVWNAFTGNHEGNIDNYWIPETIAALRKMLLFSPPKIDLIPAIRRVGEKGATTNDYSGIDLIERLAKYQNPSLQDQELKKSFEEINMFLRKVTGNHTAQLEIPYDREMVLVHMDGKTLPLSSLGTGIHEVVILAAFATVLTNQILCIEEPELHLHPLLQKKLIRYLADKTNNQYFITTHSAHLLDTPNAAIFHVRYIDGQSVVEPIYTDAAKSSVCIDLGYRASDLMQANCVIWVEGPSDRIYLNHWIRSLAPELLEGIHYSIMFYGGRLLSHLSADDAEVKEFISLRKLNRFLSVVIDSDKSSQRANISSTKMRVRDEFNIDPGFAWITKGREIENYIEPGILQDAVKKVYPNAVRLEGVKQFDHCLYFKNKKGNVITKVDKVKIAHEVAKQPPNLDILDLKPMVKKLVAFIKGANDFYEKQ